MGGLERKRVHARSRVRTGRPDREGQHMRGEETRTYSSRFTQAEQDDLLRGFLVLSRQPRSSMAAGHGFFVPPGFPACRLSSRRTVRRALSFPISATRPPVRRCGTIREDILTTARDFPRGPRVGV